MIPVDGDFIFAVAPRFSGDKADAQRRIVGAISGQFSEILESYNISTFLRIAHFMGQVTHECAGFRTTEEFASGAAYEGRQDLGNIHPGDGKRYKGRGLMQLTGRDNYRRIGGKLGLDLEGNPEQAGEPLTSLKIACEFWKSRSINDPSDRDDLEAVTRLVNGGLNGLEDRRQYLRKAKEALRARQGLIVASQQGGARPVLRRGSFGASVAELQRLLAGAGFPTAIDWDFGPATELAVLMFQRATGLEDDGIVGKDTWEALGG
ncbi:peptidoglycan-binding protein [Pseudaestuariivita atlantica]|uniref:Peptidoglycan-binding protein n=1 Tax=Pseudaestuariivita atlantica TaxID=1317121 RepID=A0A0L1JR00_9RHOB|nr:peptidoglycan-binding protein [Pseudaestuariivita atlantica]KNG93833.1 peptidoglycan-binding protein [Pseudaestuariivita atlantica]